MNTDKHPELANQEGDRMDVCSGGTDEEPQKEMEEEEEEEEKREENSHHETENGVKGDECVTTPHAIKTEAEPIEDTDDQYQAVEKEDEIVQKEEAEDGMEDGFDEEEEDEDRDRDEEGESLNEPEDLSLVDYPRYNGIALTDAESAESGAGADGSYASEASASRIQTTGKLSCDICGLSCVSINVLMVHKRSHTGERPFHCNQCGSSFTQKGNLLRHIKLHSGEKPFKCPMCSYACRRRDALSGHLRTHSVEKPFKCNHCSRSYKQRSSLEEHRERCHVYIQSKGPAEREDSQTSRTHMGSERALLLDRLASNVAKRKSSMPQKFTGDNGVCLDLSFNRELIHHSDMKEPSSGSPGPNGHHQQPPIILGSESDPPPSHRPFPVSLSHNDISPISLTNGHKMNMPFLGNPRVSQHPIPIDSFHSDGSPMSQPVMFSLGHLLGGGLNHQNGLPHQHAQPIPMSPLEALRVVRADGDAGPLPGAAYPCVHCRVIFLDYVMFTIHMGCHGFRDPLECNVCGHRSRDRYEFTSHIARGEHRLEAK